MMESGMDTGLVHAAGYGPPGGAPPGGYGPPGGGGYGPPGGGSPMGGPPGYGPPPGAPPGGFGPPGGPPGYGPPPGGYGPPPGFGPPGGPPGMMMGGPRFNPLAITSLILGILSIPGCCCWFLGAPMAVAGLVLGIVGMGKIRSDPQQWKGSEMAIAGIVCAGIGLVMLLLAWFTPWDDQARSLFGVGL